MQTPSAKRLKAMAEFFECMGKAETVLRANEGKVLTEVLPPLLAGRHLLLSPAMSHGLSIFLDGCANQAEVQDVLAAMVKGRTA